MKTNNLAFLAKLLYVLYNSLMQNFLGQQITNSKIMFADAKAIDLKLNDTNSVEKTDPYEDGFWDAYYTAWLKHCPKENGIMSLQCKADEEDMKSMSGIYKYKETSSVQYDLGYSDGYEEAWMNHCFGRLNRINFKACEEDTIYYLKQYIESSKEGINTAGVKAAYGLTMLHIASKFGRCELIDSLVENGADLYVKNKDSQTPLQFGIQNRQTESIKCLLQYYNNPFNSKSSVKNIKIKDVEIKSMDKTIPVAFVLSDDGNVKIISSESLDLGSFSELLEWAKDNHVDFDNSNFELNSEGYVEDSGIYYSSILSGHDLQEEL
ncbi:hypothetical protein phytr_12110 [Candidatus Phycorickettsia trachydisci]|uniref:Uncharacterized protein n=1 Tax=Candidatus Phycorickettsia trachydisci TaxID=2115978 RepID=A0A2P1PA65_9RICK|nr:ankyrin repeat domain-containing protein [Candidatus Phycorickettsia trachydisci]AVP88136.1 hypothetical protein phytr_12110 [Candidatus Phycorickettsia trachydisci]